MGMGSITTSELFVFGILFFIIIFIYFFIIFVAISPMLITDGCGGDRVFAENVIK